jgi:hypothetical protein
MVGKQDKTPQLSIFDTPLARFINLNHKFVFLNTGPSDEPSDENLNCCCRNIYSFKLCSRNLRNEFY